MGGVGGWVGWLVGREKQELREEERYFNKEKCPRPNETRLGLETWRFFWSVI